MSFDDIPRVPLAHAPTPLEPLGRLRDAVGGPRIWIKRDDCTGLATGGNKTRKLEYLIAEAEAAQAEVVVTFGALQSNHARQTAAACARRGLRCELILTPAVPRTEDGYERAGNLLLDRLLGARVHRVGEGETPRAVLDRILEDHADAGRRAYVIPTGGSNAVGALGYVRCGREIAAQFRERGLFPTAVIHGTSTGGTQAGLLAGLVTAGLTTRVVGINVYTEDTDGLRATVARLTDEVLTRIAPGMAPGPGAVEVEDGQLGAGYGIATPQMVEAVSLLARTEGILLDPVYSGKAMAGLLAMIDRGAFDPEDDVVFVHTGGTTALSVYTSVFAGPSETGDNAT
ncbi:MAG: D-cysteine desulfhydrase family protein [Pseudomonadales bacterium]|jgi:D-cysteine desulfhydrase family pyridoxal phosphate-dependent enzyme|nr:D-cysteine desulfhydrase family protein [Pseudomonadales bacterium]